MMLWLHDVMTALTPNSHAMMGPRYDWPRLNVMRWLNEQDIFPRFDSAIWIKTFAYPVQLHKRNHKYSNETKGIFTDISYNYAINSATKWARTYSYSFHSKRKQNSSADLAGHVHRRCLANVDGYTFFPSTIKSRGTGCDDFQFCWSTRD